MFGYRKRKGAQGVSARAIRDIMTREVLYYALQARVLVVRCLIFRTCHKPQLYYGQPDQYFSSQAGEVQKISIEI